MSKEIEEWAVRMRGLAEKMKEAAPKGIEGERVVERVWLDLGGIATQALIQGITALETIARELQKISWCSDLTRKELQKISDHLAVGIAHDNGADF